MCYVLCCCILVFHHKKSEHMSTDVKLLAKHLDLSKGGELGKKKKTLRDWKW